MKKLLNKIFGMDNETPPFDSFGLTFDNIDVAKTSLLQKKESDLKSFSKLILETTEIKLTPKPKTLSELEKLYYNIFIDKNKKTNIDRAEFENFLSLYFMHILVENKVANWNVEKNPFSKNRYNLVVEFDKENNTTGGFATELYENEDEYGREYLFNRLSDYMKL